MAKQPKEKKQSNLTTGIIALVLGIILACVKNYVWVLFGVIEIPLPVLGVICIVIGVVYIILGIRDKKKEKQAEEAKL